jgi:cyclase
VAVFEVLKMSTVSLRAGADKVSINTSALARPQLIAEIADRFGSRIFSSFSVDARRARTDSGF